MVADWFERLKRLWLAKDVESVRGLLSDEFCYFESPFDEVLTTWEAVKKEWEVVRSQTIVSLDIHVLMAEKKEGTAMYTLVMKTPEGTAVRSCGAYFVRLDDQGRAVEFRQWWMNQ